MKNIISLLILIFGLISCDYSLDYYFEVENQLTEDIRFVFVTKDDPESLNFGKEVDIIIVPHTKEKVSSYWGGVGGHKDKAGDPFPAEMNLPPIEADYIKIYIGETLLDTEKVNRITQRKNWEYHPNGQLTTYTLVVTKELLKK